MAETSELVREWNLAKQGEEAAAANLRAAAVEECIERARYLLENREEMFSGLPPSAPPEPSPGDVFAWAEGHDVKVGIAGLKGGWETLVTVHKSRLTVSGNP